MKTNFDYSVVPFDYVHCFNHDCPRAEGCLRHLTALNAPRSATFVRTLNPAAYPANPNRCAHFKTATKLRMAWGMVKLYASLSYQTAFLLKKDIRPLFPRVAYYRMVHGKRAITPIEQAKIAKAFEKNGITIPPVFDYYTEEYIWD